MVKSLFRISVSFGLLGMAFGIFMGIRQDFTLAPAHAHLNLLGFVVMFLSALYYRAFPRAAASRLAPYQAIVSVVGAIVFPVGVAGVLLGGHDRFEPVVVAGALTVLLGMAMFAAIVFRTSGLERETTAEAGPANREIRPALSELGSS
jgi:drug/metabolite transporter (DMT)-like permease